MGIPADPGGGAATTLRLAAPAELCAAPRVPEAHGTPLELSSMLGVLRRPQTEPDGLPTLNRPGRDVEDDLSWLPLAVYSPDGVRRPGLGTSSSELHLVPGVDVDTQEGAPCGTAAWLAERGRTPTESASLCLVAGPAGGPLAVRCFTPDEIRAGAALAVTAPDTVHGVVPDGIDFVVLDTGRETVSAGVTENAYVARLPGAQPGGSIEVRLERASECTPRVSHELRTAVGALREPPPPGGAVPRAVLDALPGSAVEEAARIAGGGDEVSFWIVPFVAPSADGPCAPAGHACVVPARGDERVGAPLCASVHDIETNGSYLAGPLDDRVVVYGFPPPGTTRLGVALDGRPSGSVAVSGDVAAGLLPPGVHWRDLADVRFSSEPADRLP